MRAGIPGSRLPVHDRDRAASRRLALGAFSRMRGGSLELIEPDGRTTQLRRSRRRSERRPSRSTRPPSTGPCSAAASVSARPTATASGTATTWSRWSGSRSATWDRSTVWRRRLHPILAPIQRTLWRVPRNSKRAAAPPHLRALRPGQRSLRPLPGRVDDVLVGRLPDPEATLAEAQENRLERICQALELGPDDHLLEIGTGWGAMAAHAAANYGCRVTTTTISQGAARGRAPPDRGRRGRGPRHGPARRLPDLRGRYTKLVSLEMIEAVGWQYFDVFFRRCSELLEPDGLFFLQAIVIDDRLYEPRRQRRASPTS